MSLSRLVPISMPLLLCAVFPVLSFAEPGATHSPAECEVWAREISFARSVQEHDAAAFAAHLDPGAVFDAANATPTRGREAIVEAWAGLIAGKGVALDWYPTRTTVGTGAAGNIAWSSGPYLLTILEGEGAPQRFHGTFRSVWQKGADGIWVVVYDAGGDGHRPATEDDVERFRAGRRETCSQPPPS